MASGSELSPGLAELPAAALPPSARVHLAHAVLQGIATETGLRMLHIKGPALLPGLRVAHHGSTDADVLLPPAEFPRFEDALQSRGWDRRSHLGSGSAFEHATIWWHPDWGYADVHARWPGVTIGDAEAFAILAEEAFDLEIAHVPCLVPGRTAQIVILLLHAARSAGNNDVELAWQSQSAAQQDLVRQLVSRVGAEVALAAALGELEEHRADPSYQLWKYYRAGRSPTDRVARPHGGRHDLARAAPGRPVGCRRQRGPPGDAAGTPALGGGAAAGACDPDHHAAARAGGDPASGSGEE